MVAHVTDHYSEDECKQLISHATSVLLQLLFNDYSLAEEEPKQKSQ